MRKIYTLVFYPFTLCPPGSASASVRWGNAGIRNGYMSLDSSGFSIWRVPHGSLPSERCGSVFCFPAGFAQRIQHFPRRGRKAGGEAPPPPVAARFFLKEDERNGNVVRIIRHKKEISGGLK